MKKLVKAFLGAAEDLAAIRSLAARRDVDVVAVAFDLGGRVELRELHDRARAAGAVRCHTLDVRDEFMREYVLRTIHARADGDDMSAALGRELIGRKLAEIAEIEGDAQVIDGVGGMGEVASSRTTAGQHLDRAARVDLAFDGGLPVAINEIPMTLTEIVECLATIAAAHGVGGARPAVTILQAAHRELASGGDRASGTVRLEVFNGQLVACRELATR